MRKKKNLFRQMVWLVVDRFALGRGFVIMPPTPETESWFLKILSTTPGDYDIEVECKPGGQHFIVRCGYDVVYCHNNTRVLKTPAEVVSAIKSIHSHNKFLLLRRSG